jgi:hypothetical protein
MSRGRTDKLPLQNARDRHPEKYLRERLGEGPAGEAEHFIRCPACDGWMDCRDLDQVFEHEGPLPHPAQDQPQ